jgi:hypothetical protein
LSQATAGHQGVNGNFHPVTGVLLVIGIAALAAAGCLFHLLQRCNRKHAWSSERQGVRPVISCLFIVACSGCAIKDIIRRMSLLDEASDETHYSESS